MKYPEPSIRRMARRLALPVFQHHIAVNGEDRITIRIAFLRRAGITRDYSAQVVRLGCRPYMLFSYDPLHEERGHIRPSWGKENSLMFYSASSARVLRSFAGERKDDIRFRFVGCHKVFADKSGIPVTVVWRIASCPIKDIAAITLSEYDGKNK